MPLAGNNRIDPILLGSKNPSNFKPRMGFRSVDLGVESGYICRVVTYIILADYCDSYKLLI